MHARVAQEGLCSLTNTFASEQGCCVQVACTGGVRRWHVQLRTPEVSLPIAIWIPRSREPRWGMVGTRDCVEPSDACRHVFRCYLSNVHLLVGSCARGWCGCCGRWLPFWVQFNATTQPGGCTGCSRYTKAVVPGVELESSVKIVNPLLQ